jgi:NhaA family Na+:H+ antiporter
MLVRLRRFFELKAAGGLVLFAATIVAVIVANSSLGRLYEMLLDLPTSVQVDGLIVAKPMLLWVNEGLMAVFFMHVGLEVKREVLDGSLASLTGAVLPTIGAIGGMVTPALVYLACTRGDPTLLRGWAIPTATDISFALGVLALLGSGLPNSLQGFLLTMAVIDDIGAILIIALFYTEDLSFSALLLAVFGIAGLLALNLSGVTRRTGYVLIGALVWVCVLKSGIHATLAGLIVGFTVPLRSADGGSPLRQFEHDLHPWVTFGVLPIFAFANAGVRLADVSLADLLHPVQLGIALGLLVGKQAGVFGAIWMAVRLGIGVLPKGARWLQVYGIALLTGIGFTMSLFMSTLAFPLEGYDADVRLSVLLPSTVSALGGYVVLRRSVSITARQ